MSAKSLKMKVTWELYFIVFYVKRKNKINYNKV